MTQLELPIKKQRKPTQRLLQVQAMKLYDWLKALPADQIGYRSDNLAYLATRELGFEVNHLHVRNMRKRMGFGPRPRQPKPVGVVLSPVEREGMADDLRDALLEIEKSQTLLRTTEARIRTVLGHLGPSGGAIVRAAALHSERSLP